MSAETELTAVLDDLLVASLEAEPGDVRATELWTELDELGMTSIDVPEHLGGGGGTTGQALTVVRSAGYHRTPLPVAESVFVGSWLRAAAGLPVTGGMFGVGVAGVQVPRLVETAGGGELTGSIGIPWGRLADQLLVVVEHGVISRLAVVDPRSGSGVDWTHGMNIADEPRDLVRLDAAGCQIFPLPGIAVEDTLVRAALGRTALLVGALERIVDLAVEHVTVREQFGRPLGRFQVIGHYIAQMATELIAARGALGAAARSADESPAGLADPLIVAAAKTRVGAAAELITGLGHQVHGAIGITDEHELGRYTRRVWAWRDEDGDEQHWSKVLGRETASRAYGPGLWSVIAPDTAAVALADV